MICSRLFFIKANHKNCGGLSFEHSKVNARYVIISGKVLSDTQDFFYCEALAPHTIQEKMGTMLYWMLKT